MNQVFLLKVFVGLFITRLKKIVLDSHLTGVNRMNYAKRW